MYIIYKDIVYKLNGRNGSLMWQSPLKAFSQTSWSGRPLYLDKVNDLVYAEAGHQEIVGLRDNDGSRVWQWQCIPMLTSTLRTQERRGIFRVYIDQDRIYVHSVTKAGKDGELVALDLRTGSQQWVQKWADADYPFPEVTAAHGILYTRETTMKGVRVLCAFEGTTGHELWRFEEAGASLPPDTGPVDVALFVVDGIIYDNENPLYALEVRTGKKLWEHRTFSKHCYFNHLVITKGILYADTCEGYAQNFPPEFYRVFAFDAKTGKPLWRSEPGCMLCNTVSDEEAVILGRVTSQPGEKEPHMMLETYEAESGSRRWQIMVGEKSLFDRMRNDHRPWMDVAEKRLYILYDTQPKLLQVFDMASGQHLTQFPLSLLDDEGILQSWLRNGMLYTYSWKRYDKRGSYAISAMRLADGATLWRYEIGTLKALDPTAKVVLAP